MVTKQSAGILLYRLSPYPQVFLVHPGGPYWRNKSTGSWTIPKGEFTADEPALNAAIREFQEETGVRPDGHFQPLSPIRQKGGKTVYAWAIEGNLDPEKLVSNTFELEWPRASGRMQTFPEVDRGAWYSIEMARLVINPAQNAFLDELATLLSSPQPT
ncbi:MAG TPA: NUDIX domain-containing protein [Puia sp.]|jgi:predicted NUDIX family NTP pyrophosphohydrolase|nr:NUDIX domain-containing protein [Puia sp.]